MAGRPKASLSKKPVRKITKVAGKSYSIGLPMEAVKKFGWKERHYVVCVFLGCLGWV